MQIKQSDRERNWTKWKEKRVKIYINKSEGNEGESNDDLKERKKKVLWKSNAKHYSEILCKE
jgi:hypothetical protein